MKKHFITGLIFLLPLAVTLAIVVFIVNFLTQPFVGVVENFLKSYDLHTTGFFLLSEERLLHYGSQIIILVCLFLFTVALGMLTRWFFIHSLIRLGDYVLHRIPIFNKVYKTSQDIITTIFTTQTNSFKQVVMVPFPTPRTFSLGFVTREAPPICEHAADTDLLSIFVPTTPNPTSGYLLMFQREDIHFLDMKVEDAVKFIISVGVIFPEGRRRQTKLKQEELSDDSPKDKPETKQGN